MSKPILDDLIERYENNNESIDEDYREFFQKYIECIKIQKKKGQSKGDRYFTFSCFKPAFEQLLKNRGFDVKDEVDLYHPNKKIPFLNNLVKDRFKDYKKTKKIDFVTIKNQEKKKILFIEIKMTISANAMLSGLFELGLIDEKKIPSEYEPYFILLSGYTDKPEKYDRVFKIFREIFIESHLEKNCKFVLLDPKKCINEKEFYNEILS